MSDNLESQIEDLQVKFSFQEETIEALNEVILRQQRSIEHLTNQMTMLRSRLDSMSSNDVNPQDNEPPPHY